jgi:hypothetical protein
MRGVQSCRMVRVWAAVFALSAVVAAAGLAAGATRVGTATAACPVRSFDVSFDPKRRVVVTSGGRVLASATFRTQSVGGSCRRVREPKGFLERGIGRAIRSPLGFHCAANKPIRVHVNPILDRGKIVGSDLSVGIGNPLRVIVSAVLKKGDPRASRVYRASAYCKLGAG